MMYYKTRVGINKAYQDICNRYNYVTAEKVSRDMDKLSKEIEQMESFICQAI